MAPENTPILPRGMRLPPDTLRRIRGVLKTKRGVKPDEAGHAVLSGVDETCRFDPIMPDLAVQQTAPEGQIACDSAECPAPMRNRRFLDEKS